MVRTPQPPDKGNGRRIKPTRPYPDFPLFPHSNGSWAKKIGGKLYYFGPWADWQAALRKYHDMANGPPSSLQACVKKHVESRGSLQQSGEITLRHLKDIEYTLAGLSEIVGPTKPIARVSSEDFERWRAHLGKTNGAVAIAGHVMRARAFFNWCARERIITALPPGDGLRKPSRTVLRRARAERGSRMFTPKEIYFMLQCAGPQVRAMILLALNCGLGNNDIAQLNTGHIQGKWLVYPRPKTGIERRAPLWPETRAALAAVVREGDEVVFRTRWGNPWTAKSKYGGDSPISMRFTKLCRTVGIYRLGRGFYSLRHVCQTIGEESGDHAATEYILGHAPPADDMASVYRERMSDARLFRVAKHIRRWLFKGCNKALLPSLWPNLFPVPEQVPVLPQHVPPLESAGPESAPAPSGR